MTLILEQASDALTIYGPVSVEAVSSDNKLITMDAIEEALPQIMEDPQNRVSILHKDQLVGDVIKQAEADPTAAPTSEARDLVEHLNERFGGLKTGVYEVTEPIAQAFPHLDTRVGEDVFFAAAHIKGSNETQQKVQEDIRQGNLDGFSLSGAPVEQEVVRHCDGAECERVTRIEEMDLSAITLGSRTEDGQSPFAARVRNPGAAFQVVQQAGCCEACEQANDTPKLVEVVQGDSLRDKVESCVKQLKAEGHDQSSAIAICRDAINEAVQSLVDDAVTYDDEDDEDEQTEQAESSSSDSSSSTETTMTQTEQGTEAESDSTADTVEEADESAEEILMELRNRLESLEQEVAEVRGQTEEADDDEAPEDDDEDEEDVEVNVDDEDDEEEQADASEPETDEPDLEQLDKKIEEKLESKLEQANVAETPSPEAHTTEQGDANEPSVAAQLEQAIIAGDRNAMDQILIENGVI